MHQGGTVSVCAHKWGLINSHKASQHPLTLWSRAVIPPPMIPLPYSNSSSYSSHVRPHSLNVACVHASEVT